MTKLRVLQTFHKGLNGVVLFGREVFTWHSRVRRNVHECNIEDRP